jgi:hypothetical protein
MGIAPMNQNEQQRASLAWLRERVSGYPVNGPSEGITEASMAPYFEKARALMDQFYALGDCTTCCEGDGDFECHTSSSSDSDMDEPEATTVRVSRGKEPQRLGFM